MDLETAVRIGMELRRTVQTDAFAEVINVMKQQYNAQIFDSQPGETEVRERAYQAAHALDELLITINTFVSIAEADVLEIDEDQIDIYE